MFDYTTCGICGSSVRTAFGIQHDMAAHDAYFAATVENTVTVGSEVWYCLTDDRHIAAGCVGHDTITGFCPGTGPRTTRDDDDTLGSCGCRDYHMADCDLMTGGRDYWSQDEWDDDRMDPYGD